MPSPFLAPPATVLAGRIMHRNLLDAIAMSVPADPHPAVEAATVTRLLRPVPWYERGHFTSLLVTCYPALAMRAARVVGAAARSARVVSRVPRRDRETRPRYEVIVPTADMTDLTVWLRRQWDEVARRVTAPVAHEQRYAAARTMWRTALLVASSNPRRTQVRVQAPDVSVLHTLAQAGRALGVVGNLHSGRNGHFVTVDDRAGMIRLLRVVGAGAHADAWVRPLTRKLPSTRPASPLAS